MKKRMLLLLLPLVALPVFFGGCASSSHCNNDACYDRNVSSVDPYRKGDIAAWGSEKKVADEEEKNERMVQRRMHTPAQRGR